MIRARFHVNDEDSLDPLTAEQLVVRSKMEEWNKFQMEGDK